MPVVEFALIKLNPDFDQNAFTSLVKECQRVQTKWSHENQPHILAGKPYDNLSNFYYSTSQDPSLLITAPWDSPAGHADWLYSEENQVGYTEVTKYIDESPGAVVLFHMEPAGEKSDLGGDLFAQQPFSVCRVPVKDDQKEAVQDKYRSIESQVGENGRIWAGWRIEKEVDSEELVVFWTQGVSEGQLSDLVGAADAQRSQFKSIV